MMWGVREEERGGERTTADTERKAEAEINRYRDI